MSIDSLYLLITDSLIKVSLIPLHMYALITTDHWTYTTNVMVVIYTIDITTMHFVPLVMVWPIA